MTTPLPLRGDNCWLVDFRHKGKRYRKRFPFDQYGETPAVAQHHIDDIMSETMEFDRSSDIAATVDAYLRHKEKIKGVKWTTIRADRNRLNIFVGFCNKAGIRTLNRISIKTIRAFQEYYLLNAPFGNRLHLRRKPNPKATWQKYRQILSALFIWAMKRDLMADNPAADDEFKETITNNVPEIFTHDELQRLFDYFDQKDEGQPVSYVSTAFRFWAYTGARPAELWTLKWTKVDLSNGLIHFVGTKTDRDRTVPISDKLLPYVERLPRDTTYVWDDGRGGWLYHESAWWRHLNRAMKATGVYRPDVTRNLYTFRHTFCANLFLSGTPITVAMALMGHTNVETTMIYAKHFYPNDTRTAIDRLPY